MGQETGYFGLHAVAAGEEGLLEDKEIYVRGYPEIEMKEENLVRFEQWETKGRVVELDGKKGLFYHSSNAYPGLDGSAVYYRNDKNSFCVIGVHVDNNKDTSKACWITKEEWQKFYRREKCESIIQSKNDENDI